MTAILAQIGTASLQVGMWYAVAVAALFGSAVAAGAEIGIFSLSKVRLRLLTHKREPSAVTLSNWMRQPTYALEGLLILQNITGFIFSAAVTNIMAATGLGHTSQVIVSTLIVMPLILVMADIMPKDLFNTHADQWMYRLVPVLKVAFGVITILPLLPLVRVLSRASTWAFRRGRRDADVAGPRGEMVKLLQESTATGVISSAQQDIVQRALRLAKITVRDVMMPWNRVIGVPPTISRDGFRALVRRYPVSRVPVLGKTTTEVLGTVDVMDVLAAPNQSPTARVTDYLRPHMTLIGEQDVRSALTLMQRARQTMAVVIDRQGRAIGLVTLKDLIEELVGDLDNW